MLIRRWRLNLIIFLEDIDRKSMVNIINTNENFQIEVKNAIRNQRLEDAFN